MSFRLLANARNKIGKFFFRIPSLKNNSNNKVLSRIRIKSSLTNETLTLSTTLTQDSIFCSGLHIQSKQTKAKRLFGLHWEICCASLPRWERNTKNTKTSRLNMTLSLRISRQAFSTSMRLTFMSHFTKPYFKQYEIMLAMIFQLSILLGTAQA